MRFHLNKRAFTLLEIVIVIIITGVLAGLALPRFFGMVEFSRSNEAFHFFSGIRQSLERCYVLNNGDYVNCGDFTNLDIENPANYPNTHFDFSFSDLGQSGYTIIASRNMVEGGDGSSTITLIQDSNTVTRSGTGAFKGIQ